MNQRFYIFVLFISLSIFAGCTTSQQLECDDAINYSQQGMNLINAEEYQLAIDAFSCAIENNPENADNYYYRAGLYFLVTEWQLAIDDYEMLLSLIGEDSEYYIDAYLFTGIAQSKVQDYENAIENVSLALDYALDIATDRQLAHVYYVRAIIYTELQDFDAAIEDFDRALLLDFQALYLAERGFTYALAGDLEAAEDNWLAALELDPDVSERFRETAWRHGIGFEYDNAIEAVEKAILLDELAGNVNWINHYILAIAQAEIGQADDALENANLAFDIALEEGLTPESEMRLYTLYLARGNAYLQLEEYDLAMADVDSFLEVNETNPASYALRADIYYELGDYDSAYADYTRAIALNGGFFDEEMEERYNEVKPD